MNAREEPSLRPGLVVTIYERDRLSRLVRRERLTQVVSLDQVAPDALQVRELRGGLDPLPDNSQAQGVSQAHHRRRGDLLFGVYFQPVDQRAVDLQEIDRQTVEVRKRRIPCPEVVYRELQPQILELPQYGAGGPRVLHDRGLADLQEQTVRSEPGLSQNPRDVPHEIGMPELTGREVDAHRQGRTWTPPFAPPDYLRAGFLQHREPDGDDQPGLFRDPNELCGRQQTPLRVSPTHQRLDPEHLAALHRDDGLVMDPELLSLHGLLQFVLEPQPLPGVNGHLLPVEFEPVRAQHLRAVHSGVRLLEQAGPVLPVRRIERDPYADGYAQLVVLQLVRFGERLDDPARYPGGVLHLDDVRQQHDELVARQPGDRICLPHAAHQPIGHLLEYQVADVVPEGVVDELEAVQIEKQERHSGLPAARPRYRLVHAVVQEPAVGQFRKQVVVGQTVEVALGELPFGYVAQQQQAVRAPIVRLSQRREHQAIVAALGSRTGAHLRVLRPLPPKAPGHGGIAAAFDQPPRTVRHEPGHVLPDGFGTRLAEDLLRGRVEVQDPVLRVQHDHPVGHAFDHVTAVDRNDVQQPVAPDAPRQGSDAQWESERRQVQMGERSHLRQVRPVGHPWRQYGQEQNGALFAVQAPGAEEVRDEQSGAQQEQAVRARHDHPEPEPEPHLQQAGSVRAGVAPRHISPDQRQHENRQDGEQRQVAAAEQSGPPGVVEGQAQPDRRQGQSTHKLCFCQEDLGLRIGDPQLQGVRQSPFAHDEQQQHEQERAAGATAIVGVECQGSRQGSRGQQKNNRGKELPVHAPPRSTAVISALGLMRRSSPDAWSERWIPS